MKEMDREINKKKLKKSQEAKNWWRKPIFFSNRQLRKETRGPSDTVRVRHSTVFNRTTAKKEAPISEGGGRRHKELTVPWKLNSLTGRQTSLKYTYEAPFWEGGILGAFLG